MRWISLRIRLSLKSTKCMTSILDKSRANPQIKCKGQNLIDFKNCSGRKLSTPFQKSSYPINQPVRIFLRYNNNNSFSISIDFKFSSIDSIIGKSESLDLTGSLREKIALKNLSLFQEKFLVNSLKKKILVKPVIFWLYQGPRLIWNQQIIDV